MKTTNTRMLVPGLLAGAMLTAALIAFFYMGWKLANLPFVPFDLFDWSARILPGAMIEFVISSMVAVITGLHLGETSVVAKEIEQAMGIAGLFIAGTVAGPVFFGIISRLRSRHAGALGLLLGACAGIPVVLINSSLAHALGMQRIAGWLWTLAAFSAWGLAFGRVFLRLFSPLPGVPDDKRASVERVDRRQFLIRLGGYTAIITVSGVLVGALADRRVRQAGAKRWSDAHALPNANSAVKPVPGTRPEYTPLDRHYRIDINTVPPRIDEALWRLKIGGLVTMPLTLTLADLRGYEPTHQFITLSCISNPVGGDLIGTTRWTGVSVKRLLPDLRLKPTATHLKLRSADGFWEVIPIETITSDERVMLVYEWDGVPLLPEHGFPLRTYIPDVHGMKQPKWIDSIEATDHWEPGYWVERGWDRSARMKTTSVIDTVAVDMGIISADNQSIVPIGGIAHAGARGISKVEVRVDEGPWQQAALREPLSHLTWVMWRYDWRFSPGKHTFTVRCFDGAGAPQIVTPAPPAPSGASGLFCKTQKL